MLFYEENILKDTKGESFVLVSGFGIHLNKVINLNIMLYLNKYSLTLLLNFNDFPLQINNEYFRNLKNLDKQARKKIYLKGGVYLGSSRILLTDFLEDNLPIDKISCIIINDADKIRENSIEAFILYIFRRKNDKRLIKAFSSNCISFAYGIGSLEKYVNILRCDNFVLYPRFHENIMKSFKNDMNFTQHEFKMTNEMIEVQMILIEILKELIKHHKLDIDYEFVLVSMKYTQDILDIKYLISLLFSCNLLRFYMECMKFIYKQIDLGKDSTWLNSGYTSILIDKIEMNCLENEKEMEDIKNIKYFLKYKKLKTNEDGKKNEDIKNTIENNDDKLWNPKFKRLMKLVSNSNESNFLIVLPSPGVLFDVENHLKNFTNKNLIFYLKKDFINSEIIFNDDKLEEDFIHMNKELNQSKTHEEFFIFYTKNNKKDILEIDKQSSNILYFDKDKKYEIILFDKDLSCIRKCEYIGTLININVHSFQFRDSIEEQINLLRLRNEKLYFEQLINKRSNMPVLLDINKNILEDEASDENEIKYDVIVDSRELRADLPFFLYKAGNNLIISTLQIGDYLINEDICIERKNIHDFISSCNTGRLYSQTRMLTLYYLNSIILLEFNSRPCLSDFYNHNSDTFRNSLISKFCLFLITFPGVKIIWSESTLFTTKTFRRIQNKNNKEDEIVKNINNSEIDPVLQEILLSIPGINQFNIKKIIKNFKNIRDIFNSKKVTLQRILGQETGNKIYKFINENFEI
ncbi:DNA repair protein RAD16-like [Vairimorpha necatrix]|uniref:DNA repair protein RAD16-like n=1 Tax=Vairimorpha necatrix TaxID=6039 RepID=A0AAX4JDX1_9MICR